MNRRRRVDEISNRLGRKKLIWYGTRGTDSQPLLQLPQFAELFCIIAPLSSVALSMEVCLERLKMRRVDLDAYRVDGDLSLEAADLRRKLFDALGEPCFVATYRPDNFFASVYFPRAELVEYLGLFHELQAPFEHKPWVETELHKKAEVPVVGWRYFGDNDRWILEDMLQHGPVVLRTNRSDGGAGLALIHEPADITRCWPSHSDHFLAVAPFMSPNIPVNVNACVFGDGSVALHSASLQLIGIPGCTDRVFGYCGNDFAQIRELEEPVLDALEGMTYRVGRWLRQCGYLGAFGIDAIMYEGEVYLTEVNPRFQGSSQVAAELDARLDRPDLFLNHLAAFLGLPPPLPVRLRDLVREQPRMSQIICHNCRGSPAYRNSEPAPDWGRIRCVLSPERGVTVDREAIMFRAVIEDSVTEDGLHLRSEYPPLLEDFCRRLFVDDRSEAFGEKVQ